jgi:hypothetical protein
MNSYLKFFQQRVALFEGLPISATEKNVVLMAWFEHQIEQELEMIMDSLNESVEACNVPVLMALEQTQKSLIQLHSALQHFGRGIEIVRLYNAIQWALEEKVSNENLLDLVMDREYQEITMLAQQAHKVRMNNPSLASEG